MVPTCRATSTSPPSAASSRAGPPPRCRSSASASGSETLYGFALFTSGEAGFAFVRASANTEEGLARARRPARRGRHALPGRGRAPPAPVGRAGVGVPRLRAEGVRALALPDPAARPADPRPRALRGVRGRAQGGGPRRPLRARGRAGFPHREHPLRAPPRRPSSGRGLVGLNPVPHRGAPPPRDLARAVHALREPRAAPRADADLARALRGPLHGVEDRHRRGGARARHSRRGRWRRSSSGSGRRSCRSSSTSSRTTASRRPSTTTAGSRRARCGSRGARCSSSGGSAWSPEREIERLQRLVGEFVERDRRLRVASTLAENAARVLHELRPRRFPPTRDGPADLQAPQPGALPAPAG